MANNQTGRRERVDWLMGEIEKAHPGIPVHRLKGLLAAQFFIGKVAIESDIITLLGQPGIVNRNGLVCLASALEA